MLNTALTKQVARFIKRAVFFKKGETVIVAVSGGPDSVMLLYALYALRHKLGINLHIAHVNHNLRKGSRKDRQFVERLAKKLATPCTTGSVVIRTKTKGSLEEKAREARLQFLTRVAKKQKARTIALGHTQDDLAETVLMRIVRGTGLDGLRAIAPKRSIGNITLVRPLLTVRKRDICALLRKKRIPFCTDETNRNTVFFRNKIRRELIPLLERKYNTGIVSTLAHLAETTAHDYDYLMASTEKKFASHCRVSKKKQSIEIPLAMFKRQHSSIQRMLLRIAIAQFTGNTRRLTLTHIHEIEQLIALCPVHAEVHLPQGLRIVKTRTALRIARRKS